MIVRYSWSPETSDPNEITATEIEDAHVPREGELVEIDFREHDGTRVKKSGRVKDVVWRICKTTSGVRARSVTVILGR